MIEISLWEQLTAFADCGTLSEAAEKLHTSQPALTRSMKRLEAELSLSLFKRSKNHISLNATGRMAVNLARQIVEEDRELVLRLKAYDRSLRTISIGYCAPVPQMVMTPLINNLFEGMTISADMKEDEDFPARLLDGTYQLAVLHYPLTDDRFFCRKCGSETLYLSVPPSSPLAFYPEIHLSDLNGLSVLLLSRIGFWMNVVKEKAPKANYLLLVQASSFMELASHSGYPCFNSSYFIRRGSTIPGRINIPLADAEGHTDYYLACLSSETRRFSALFDQMKKTGIS